MPLIGAFALGSETSSWYMTQRSEQNAADSAVLAAALKGSGGADAEAKAVTNAYGYKNLANNTTITTSTPTCPSSALSGATCYKVQVSRNVPIYLSRVVGYSGDVALGAGRAKTISASAVAGLTTGTTNFCLIAINDFRINGSPKGNLTGCDLLAQNDLTCNGSGSDEGVVHGYAGDKNKKCGTTQVENYPFPGDPKAAKVNANISALSCSYGAGGTISSLASGTNCFSGNVKLGGDITVPNANTVLVVKSNGATGANGGLDLNGHTLKTTGSGSLTIVFTGSNALNTPVIPGNGGTMDFAAPKTGDWQGMAVVEDPNTPDNSNLDWDYAGGANVVTLDITGLIYMPNADFTIKGAIDHASNGYRCIAIIANNILVSGTGSIFDNPTSECRQAGLTLPTVPMIALLH